MKNSVQEEIQKVRESIEALTKQIRKCQAQRRMAHREITRLCRQRGREQEMNRTSTIYGVGPGWNI